MAIGFVIQSLYLLFLSSFYYFKDLKYHKKED